MASPFGYLLGSEPPSRRSGALAAMAAVALCTLIVYPLKHVAPVVSLSVVYLPAVLLISATWGGWLGAATGVLSALAFNFFHLPPTGQLTIRNADNWVALVTFLIVAWLVSSVAEVTRARAREAVERRREADLAAEMARLLLRGNPLEVDLPAAAARLAQVLGLQAVAIELGAVEGDERHLAFALRDGARRLGTLTAPADAGEEKLRRLQERVVPALEALLSAALERESLLGDVVENAALRRADVVKTALLRAVSHDLRSPLTAISTASEAIASPTLSEQERLEMAAIIQQEAGRLSRLVDNLLDLSRLEAGVAEPQAEWTAVDELIHAALQEIAAKPQEFALAIDRDLPLVKADPVQLERAFVNVLENARRHAGGHPVSVRARAVRTIVAAPAAGTEAGRAHAGADAGPSGIAAGAGAPGIAAGAVRVPADDELAADHGRGRAADRGRGRAADRGRGPAAMADHGPAGDRLIVRVVDRGPGIPPAQLERVFEPFFRTHPPAGTPQGGHRGSGLGLAIARGFTAANGGRLHAESLPGQGTSFVFELPLSELAPAAAAGRLQPAGGRREP